MEFKNYYDTMGLQRDASPEEIRHAYRKLARKLHPDVSKEPDAEARFKELGEAYEVLKDPEKRAAYDQLGMNWRDGQDFTPPPDWNPGFAFGGGGYTPGDSGAFSDFFESLFGHGFGPGPAAQTSAGDHRARVDIDLEDACRGATRRITLQSREIDEHGRVRLRDRSLNVRIPKGVKPGQMIRLSGQGEPAQGQGAPGDLYLEVRLKPHRLYRVDGRDLYFDLPVAPWEAALGATVKAPTPGGVVDLRIPPGSGSGRKLRLQGRGIPGNPPGDVYAVLRIAVPPADDEPARERYRKMAREFDFNPRAGMIG